MVRYFLVLAIISGYIVTLPLIREGCIKGGGMFFNIWKHDFELRVSGDGLDMYPQLEGGFGSMRIVLPIYSFPLQNETTSEVYVGDFGLHNSVYLN